MLAPKVMVLEGGAFREVVKPWGWSPHEWNQCPYKRDTRELPGPFHIVRPQKACSPEDGPHLITLAAWSWTSRLQNCEKQISVYKLPCLYISLEHFKQTKTAVSVSCWVRCYGCLLNVLSCFNCVWLFATAWTVAHQASLSMGFSRQEHWSGLPFPSPGDLPNPGIEPSYPHLLCLLHWQAGSLPLVPPGIKDACQWKGLPRWHMW